MQKQQLQGANQVQSQNKIQSNHSLSADLAMGWRPKLKVIGPIPLNFDNQPIDKSIKQLLKSQASIYSIIYLDIRSKTFEYLQNALSSQKKLQIQISASLFCIIWSFKSIFSQILQLILAQNETSIYRYPFNQLFQGMNPKFKSYKISFDSCFQSGNLDAVVKVTQNQYDLILRIDSNTAGHIMWYYFKVCNNQSKQQNIKINIINLRRNKSCYQRGMKPFIRKRNRSNIQNNGNNTKQQQNWSSWFQGGQNIQVDEQKIRFQKQSFVFNNGMAGLAQPPKLFRYLSFQLKLQPMQQFQIAYCIPYTYSDMINDLKLLKQTIVDQRPKNIHFQIQSSNQSLSGLQIPILKITDKTQDKYDQQTQKNKYCVFILGRQHPGQSNGSYVMRGILNQLIKNIPQMMFLRKHFVFKIIPMLNVDGVVMGNFRTSLYGKDLNRLFKKSQLFLIPEVQMCKNQFSNLLRIHKNKVMLFLDIHGHSARRNAFCYGPGILDANAFSDVRELAKIIATRTQIFRYPSCTFRINQDKQTTARACFSKSVSLGYTIQSSNWSFYSKSQSKMVDFNENSWQKVGNAVIEGTYVYAYQKIKKKLQKKKKRNNKTKQQKDQLIIDQKMFYNNEFDKKVKKDDSPQKQILRKSSRIDRKQSSKQRTEQTRNEQYSKNMERKNSTRRLPDQKSSPYQINQIEEEQNQSDRMSDNEMDSDSQGQDMQKQKFQKYMNGAKKMMIQFEKVYFGQDYQRKGKMVQRLKNQNKRLMKQSSTKNFKKNSQILACLRKKQYNPSNNTNLKAVLKVQTSPNKMVDIATKITLQHRKINNKNTNRQNNQQSYAQQQQNQQNYQKSKQIWKIQKIPFGKHKIQSYSNYSPDQRRKNTRPNNQKISILQKLSKIQQWSQKKETPQLQLNEENGRYSRLQLQSKNQFEKYHHMEHDLNKKQNRRKALTNYQISKKSRLSPQIRRLNPPFQTVQSNNIQNQYEQDQNEMQYQFNSSDSQNDDSIKYQIQSRKQNRQKNRLKKKESEINYSNANEQQENQNQHYGQNFITGSKKVQGSLPPSQSNFAYDQLSKIIRIEQQAIKQKNNKSLRFSMKNSIERIPEKYQLIKGKNQYEKMDKINLIKKLNDPISMNYGMNSNIINNRQILSSQDITEYKNKNSKNLNLDSKHLNLDNKSLNFQFYQINYLKPQQTYLNNYNELSSNKSQYSYNNQVVPFNSSHDRLMQSSGSSTNKNHQKIQQIISNNMKSKQIKIKNKQFNKNQRQWREYKTFQQKKQLKYIEEKQKLQFTVKAAPIRSMNSQEEFSQKNNNRNKQSIRNRISGYDQSQKSGQQKLFIQKGQVISSSLMLPKNKQYPQVQKIKTLQSQNMLKNQSKHIKISLSANRNYQQRKPDKKFDLLKQQQRINKKVLKFGGQFLPKISHSDNKNTPKRYSQDSYNNKLNNQMLLQSQSPSAKQKKDAIIQRHNMLFSSPQIDYKNIKLICISEQKLGMKGKTNTGEKLGQIVNKDQNIKNKLQQYSKKGKNIKQVTKRNNKQRLLSRLKQLEFEQKKQFGQHTLLINGQNQINQYNQGSQQIKKKHKIHMSQLQSKQYNLSQDIKMQIKISNLLKQNVLQNNDNRNDEQKQKMKVKTNFYSSNEQMQKQKSSQSVFGLPNKPYRFSGTTNGNSAK